jgi:large subunit ribosomal protein L6
LEEKPFSKFGKYKNMSRLGQKPIEIPEKTEVTVADNTITVKGPLGELSLDYDPQISVKVEEGNVVTALAKESVDNPALWGTYSSHIRSMIAGVNEEFVKKLIIEGVGYKADMKGTTLVLNVGFSHSIEMEVPEGLKVSVEGGTITVSGIDKHKVGEFSASVRDKKKPEPYKGKGIHYDDEIVRRKEGKKTV